MEKNIRVALISQDVYPAFNLFRLDLIKYLLEKGHTVFAFAINYDDSSEAYVKSLGVTPVRYKSNRKGLNPIVDILNSVTLSKQLKKLQIDSSLCFYLKPSLYGTLASWIAGVRRRIAMVEGLGYVYTPTQSGFSFKKRILQRAHGLLCTVGYSFADEVLFLNPNDPKDLSSRAILSESKLHVLGPIGLDLSAYPYRPVDLSKPIRFIFIARLLAEKGVFEFLDAARIVKKQYPDAEFVVLGGLDPYNPAALSKQQLDEVISENIIIYPGYVSNVPEWIADSHVFVLPSYREGFPRSTQEAMAIGRAVITTDVPGCRETVMNGKNGFLVPPFNEANLAEKMLYFIEQPDEIQRMGDESHRMANENYDVQKTIPTLAAILLEK